jgi:O-antigen ligase
MQVNRHSHFGPRSFAVVGCENRALETLKEAHAVKPVVRWAFYLFIASIPFETIGTGMPIELTAITGSLLVLATFLEMRVFYHWPSGPLWCFLIYLYICGVLAALEKASYRLEVAWSLVVLIQLILVFWISYNLMRNHSIARTAVLVFVGACVTLAILQVLGITARVSDAGAKVERVSAMGLNPNDLARILVLGLLAMIGLVHGQRKSTLQRYLAWPLFALMGITIVQTGSRGALVALGAGLIIFVLNEGSMWTKVRNVVTVLLLVGFFAFVSLESDTARERFERAEEEGGLARREEIYPNALEMFLEKPVVGWGVVGYTYELGSRLGHIDEQTKNAHNLILHALASTGLLGAIPLFFGIGLTVRAAWRARRGSQGVLPLAMIVTVLMANMSGLWLYKKLNWVILAYALASCGSFVSTRRRNVKVPSFSQATGVGKQIQSTGPMGLLHMSLGSSRDA